MKVKTTQRGNLSIVCRGRRRKKSIVSCLLDVLVYLYFFIELFFCFFFKSKICSAFVLFFCLFSVSINNLLIWLPCLSTVHFSPRSPGGQRHSAARWLREMLELAVAIVTGRLTCCQLFHFYYKEGKWREQKKFITGLRKARTERKARGEWS